jgi:hypothetical protein
MVKLRSRPALMKGYFERFVFDETAAKTGVPAVMHVEPFLGI